MQQRSTLDPSLAAIADLLDHEEDYRISSVAGGLAVPVIQHRAWLTRNPKFEKWCLATLRDLRPIETEHFSPVSINNHSAEAFLGEAGVALLLESDEEWVLRMVFDGLTGGYYSSTLFTMWRASQGRPG